jgi:TetR/AcrR family transcriptional repressor of nem operon
MNISSKEKILDAAKVAAQAHGYSGINFRDLAASVGIKAASVYHYFPSKSELGAAVARRYWQDTAAELDRKAAETSDAKSCLTWYPEIFRKSLANNNSLCLGSFMAAEHEDLPEEVKNEVLKFADVNIAWLKNVLIKAGIENLETGEKRARAIFSAVAGAQLIARSRSDISMFDDLIASYRAAGLLPV